VIEWAFNQLKNWLQERFIFLLNWQHALSSFSLVQSAAFLIEHVLGCGI
jgi:hypothetical protein